MSRGTTVCAEPDCPVLTTGTRCRDHERQRQQQANQRRQPRKRTYDTEQWRRRTRQQVLREEPHCRDCGRPTEHVDHIDGDQTNNDRSNLAGVCQPCHAHKTATRDQQRDEHGRWQRNDDGQREPKPKRGATGSVPLG